MIWIMFLNGIATRFLEIHPFMMSTLTFVFTDTQAAYRFLTQQRTSPIRSVEVTLLASSALTELYSTKAGEVLVSAIPGSARVSARNNPWQQLCATLADMPALRDLHIWVDSKDLRPWHRRVLESIFFGDLDTVCAGPGCTFVLSLPELPPPDTVGIDERGASSYWFLESEEVLASKPYDVVRGPRIDKWQAHLLRRSITNLGVDI
jgi:hypothetical protein